MAKNIAAKFRDAIVGHTVDLMRFAEGVREKVTVNLESLANDLESKVRKADLGESSLTPFATKRTETLIKQTKATIGTAYEENDSILAGEMRELADLEGDRAPNLLNSVFQAGLASTTLTRTDLEKLADDSLIQGGPASHWWEKQSTDLQNQFATQMRLGVSQGETNDQLVQRLRGSKTGKVRTLTAPDGSKVKVPEFAGGIMDASKQQATALVRTATQTVSNNVLHETYKDNQDVLKGVQWLSTLDSRTSPICRARDQASWDFDGNPLPESPVKLPFSTPPAHFQCRSVLIPITKSWDDLTGIKGLEEVPESTRASMDGQVAGGTTYEEWLKGQPESVQTDVLGPTRLQLWKSGKISFAEMVDQSGRALNLSELRDRAEGTSFSTQGAAPGKGSWNGFGAAELIRLAANAGLDKDQTKELLQRLNLNPADATVQKQHKFGRDGQNLPDLGDLRGEFDTHVEAVKNGSDKVPPPPPPVITPPPVVNPPVPKVTGFEDHSMTELIRLAGHNGLSVEETKNALAELGLNPSEATIRTQLRHGRNGTNVPTLPPELDAKWQELVGRTIGVVKSVPTPEPVPLPPTPEPPKPKVPSPSEVRQSIVDFGVEHDVKVSQAEDKLRKIQDEVDALAANVRNLDPAKKFKDEFFLKNPQLGAAAILSKEYQQAVVKLRNESQEYNDAVKQSLIKQKVLKTAHDELKVLREGSFVTARELLYLPNDERTKVIPVLSPSVDKATGAKAKTAAEFLESILHKDYGPSINQPTAQLASKIRAYNERGMNYLAPGDKISIHVHESGHSLEYMYPDVYQAAKDFLDRRTKGEAAKKLKDTTGGKGYEDWEITKEDKFRDPYVGKIYPGRATEVTSMGLQWLYEDPVKFAREDPDYFDFIISVVHRLHLKTTP